MTRLSVVFLLFIVAFHTTADVLPINEVIADTITQTVNIFLTNRPFAGSDPREGVIKLFCVPCKLLLMIVRLSTQNIPGITPLLTGVCSFVLGDQQTCTDQIGFISIALEFADNTQGCERFWACAKAPEPEDKKKKDPKSSKKRLHPNPRYDMEIPEDSIMLTLPAHYNSSAGISHEVFRQINRPDGNQGTTPRPNFASVDGAKNLAGGMFNTFTKLVGMGGSNKPFNDPTYSKHNPYNSKDSPDGETRPGFGANVGFGMFTSPIFDFLGKKKR